MHKWTSIKMASAIKDTFLLFLQCPLNTVFTASDFFISFRKPFPDRVWLQSYRERWPAWVPSPYWDHLQVHHDSETRLTECLLSPKLTTRYASQTDSHTWVPSPYWDHLQVHHDSETRITECPLSPKLTTRYASQTDSHTWVPSPYRDHLQVHHDSETRPSQCPLSPQLTTRYASQTEIHTWTLIIDGKNVYWKKCLLKFITFWNF